MIPTVILASCMILLIVFDLGMRDLFPAQYKTWGERQRQKWKQMAIIPFPLVEKIVMIVRYITYCYAAVLFVLVSLSAYFQLPELVQLSNKLCTYGGGILLGILLSGQLYVWIKGNIKTAQNLNTNGRWNLLFLYFTGMTYWIQTLQ